MGESAAPPGAASPPRSAPDQLAGTAKCPEWTPIDVGQVELESSAQTSVAQATTRAEQLLKRGELVAATAHANAARNLCLAATKPVPAQVVDQLGQVLERVKEATQTPKPGKAYVADARAAQADGRASEARAAWDRALLAYWRATKQPPRRVTLVPTPVAGVSRNTCMLDVHLDRRPAVKLEVEQLWGTGQRRWRLTGRDGTQLFEGVADRVFPLTEDAWLVVADHVDLMRSSGETQRLQEHACGDAFYLIDDWLIARGDASNVQILNLVHRDWSFTKPAVGTDLQATRVGSYVEVRQRTDDGMRSQVIFRLDIDDPGKTAWTPEKYPYGEVRFFVVPRWGGVLAVRTSAPDKQQPLGFSWKIAAIQLDTGKQLAQVSMPADAESVPAMTVSKRYGLAVVGSGNDVRVATLGSRSVRKVSASNVMGQVEDIEVTPDGILCTDQVVMRRYYSCNMSVTADLSGASRQRGANRFCLQNGRSSWSGVIAPERGREHLGSEGGTVMFSMCGQRLSPDGRSAAFVEVKPRKGGDEPYTGVQVAVFDTRSRKRRWRFELEGKIEPSYAYLDVSFSPDGAYLAVLYERRVDVFRLSDGARVGTRLRVDDWIGVIWIDATTFSGGNEKTPTYALQGESFSALPEAAASSDEPGGSAAAVDLEHVRCLFGTELTPAEVCSSVPPQRPQSSPQR